MSTELLTKSQEMAQKAYKQVFCQSEKTHFAEYLSFARQFPSLIHGSGLAQSAAFALSKKEPQKEYLKDLAIILGYSGQDAAKSFEKKLREVDVGGYMGMSRNALMAAGWLKRYAEALAPKANQAPTNVEE